jgi:hypothetical protein
VIGTPDGPRRLANRLLDLVSGPHGRIQHRKRVLKNQRDSRTSNASHWIAGERQKFRAAKNYGPMSPQTARKQSDNGPRRHRFPTAGLTHNTYRFSAANAKIDI